MRRMDPAHRLWLLTRPSVQRARRLQEGAGCFSLLPAQAARITGPTPHLAGLMTRSHWNEAPESSSVLRAGIPVLPKFGARSAANNELLQGALMPDVLKGTPGRRSREE